MIHLKWSHADEILNLSIVGHFFSQFKNDDELDESFAKGCVQRRCPNDIDGRADLKLN